MGDDAIPTLHLPQHSFRLITSARHLASASPEILFAAALHPK